MSPRTSSWIGALVLMASMLAGCQPGAAAPAAATPTPILLGTEVPAATALPTAGASATPAVTALPTASPTGRATEAAAPAPHPTPNAARLMAVGARAAVAVRAAPDPAAPIVITLPGSDLFWAEGRSSDGAWLRVTYGKDGHPGWVSSHDLALMGNAASLPVIQPGATEQSQPGPSLAGQVTGDSLRVRSGPGLDQPVVGALAAGTAISVTARSQDGAWLGIPWRGGEGWVSASYVKVTGDVSALPASRPSSGAPLMSSPAPAPSGARGLGKIAFQVSTGGDVYVMNADGSGLRRVASGMDPALAPDGSRLAYARWDSPNNSVYVLDLRTGQEQRVAGAVRPRSPTWSQDGSKLVFAHVLRSYSCTDTPLGCLTEQQARAIFRGGDCIDVPRLGQICLKDYPVRNIDETGLAQVTVADGTWLDLPAEVPAQSPTLRPGHNELAYRGPQGLQAVEAVSGSASRPLVNDVLVNSPSWAPDGQRLAAQARVHDHTDIVAFDASGGGRVALTQRAFLATRPVNNVAPSWSPDGRQILFLTDRDGKWQLYVMNADGSNQVPFLPDALRNISFSYDFAAERVATWSR